MPLSRKDTARNVTTQWNALRSAFADPDCVLLFHLKNHYALIFAVREWVGPSRSDNSSSGSVDVRSADEEGSAHDDKVKEDSSKKADTTVMMVHRQIYTARRGQRPKVWIDFKEARETMLGWEGYKIMSLTRHAGEGGQECEDTVAKLGEVKNLLEEHFPAQAWCGMLKHGY